MAKIPLNMKTTKNLIENAPDTIEPISRGYLGMSGIGHECVRFLWLGFRFATKEKFLSVRQKRIFERGNIEEKRIITDLKRHGIEVFRREKDGTVVEIFGEIGEKQEELSACHGHAKGHPDGRVIGIPESIKEHGLEMKTMASAYWMQLVKHGVKKAHPMYYAQMQRYMPAMGVERFLLIASNKDNEKREYERVELDKDFSQSLIEKEMNIIVSDAPAGNKFPKTWVTCNSSYYGQKCSKYDICHNNAAPAVTCRSCEHSDRAIDGVWICDLKNDERHLTLKEQLDACPSYKRSF